MSPTEMSPGMVICSVQATQPERKSNRRSLFIVHSGKAGQRGGRRLPELGEAAAFSAEENPRPEG